MPIKSLKDPDGLRNTKPMLFSIDKAQIGRKEGDYNSKPSSSRACEQNKQNEFFGSKTITWVTRPAPSVRDYPRRRLNLTKAEVQAQKEKFVVGHPCKNRELHVLLVFGDEMEREDSLSIWEEEAQQEEIWLGIAETIEPSLHSVLGLTIRGIKKLREHSIGETPSQLEQEMSINPLKRINLGILTGLLPRENSLAFERILFRVTRGTIFVKQAVVENLVTHPVSREKVEKNALLVFYSGEKVDMP